MQFTAAYGSIDRVEKRMVRAVNDDRMDNAMMNVLNNMEEILRDRICGFHEYVLTSPIHLSYVSNHLCEMTGVREQDLLDDSRDLYVRLVHASDREKYSDFLRDLAKREQTLTCEYRLLRKDGTVIHVRDTITSRRMENGILVGDSVLTDITDLKNENNDLHFFSETVPFGFLRYSCQTQPRITYINPKMIDLLRFPEVRDGEMDYLELYKSNIFLMIPMEERRRFSKYLNRVYTSDTPLAGEMTILRCDGTRAHVFGWVTKCINEKGEAEFQSACMDITEGYKARKTNESRRYLKALSDVYDKIFEFNLDTNTVKCLHCGEASQFKQFENLALQIDDALEKWLLATVAPEDQDTIRGFFMEFCQKRMHRVGGKPPQITYQALSSDDRIKEYTGMFIKIDDAVSFFCCRETKDPEDSAALKTENDRLKETMRDLVMQFSDGIAAFEVSPEGCVKPLYASDNVCEFFGYTKENWIPLTDCFTPLEVFAANSEASYEEFANLLRTGEAEFTYFDYKSKTERNIKAICSEKEPTSNSPRYVMLYAVDGTGSNGRKALPENRTVTIRTFGYFDVFVGDSPIAFRNKKSKELLALLVDRKGGYVTSEEAISFLWEDEPANSLTFSRYRKVALRLKNTLEEYGIPDIVEVVDGKRRIVMDKVECDLYRYLSGKNEYSQLFNGNYLTNYSWGETTLGELLNH